MKNLILIIFCLLLPGLAEAVVPIYGAGDMVGNALSQSTTLITNQLQSVALQLLFAFLVLQYTIDGLQKLASGDGLDGIIGHFLIFLTWAGVGVWLLSDSGTGGLTNIGWLLRSTIDFFLTKAALWTGMNGGSFDAGDIMSTGLVAYGKITIAVIKAMTTNVANLAATAAAALVPGAAPAMLFITSIMVFFISMTILLCCAYISFKVFMVKLQIAIVICAAPLSVAFLGLKGFREQGLAPFKTLISLVFRIVILAAIVSALKTVSDNLTQILDGMAFGLAADIWTPLLSGMMGFLLLAFVTHQSDGIADSLASGGSGVTTGDAMSSIKAGMAAAATVATAGAAVGAAANMAKGQSISSLVAGATKTAMEKTGLSSGGRTGRSDVSSSLSRPGGKAGGEKGSGGGGVDGKSPPPPSPSSKGGDGAGNALMASGAPGPARDAGIASAQGGAGAADVAKAVTDTGGTPEQGAAAAVGSELMKAGATKGEAAAGAQAALEGGGPKEVADAVKALNAPDDIAAAGAGAMKDVMKARAPQKPEGDGGKQKAEQAAYKAESFKAFKQAAGGLANHVERDNHHSKIHIDV